jgi:light-regulated signal transduction histidine kinase (bacteriophytochrome)
MLKDDFGNQLSAEADRQMSNIMKNAERMGQLIDELLSFSRLGRQELQKSNVNMHKLVLEVCEELKESNTARDIEFRIQPLLPAQADALAIRQVWVNLISNAVKYSALKEKAVFEIGSKTEGPEIIYSIKDNGAGFDMQYADKLFGVFHRLHPEKEFEGNGVGLAIVQRIVTKHGGRVWAEAKLNEGATFYFTLIKA